MKPTKNQLDDWYTAQRKTAREIADLCDVSHMSVKRWLRAYGIERRPSGRGLAHRGIEPPSREDLYRMVHFEHLSYREIAERYGVDYTAVPHWLRKHDIARPGVWQTRRKGADPVLPTEQELREMYAQGLSLAHIGRLCGVSRTPIDLLCRQYGIVLRPDGWQGKRFACQDGHQVRSIYEQRVDDWLTAHQVAHVYEPPLPFDRRYAADFLANGWYIEVWGVTNSASYAARKARKLRLYRAHGLPLIHMTYDAFAARRNSWERRLRAVLLPSLPLRSLPSQLQMPV